MIDTEMLLMLERKGNSTLEIHYSPAYSAILLSFKLLLVFTIFWPSFTQFSSNLGARGAKSIELRQS
jgi:hypothetical protein